MSYCIIANAVGENLVPFFPKILEVLKVGRAVVIGYRCLFCIDIHSLTVSTGTGSPTSSSCWYVINCGCGLLIDMGVVLIRYSRYYCKDDWSKEFPRDCR